MGTQRPNLGLFSSYAKGEDDWDVQMNMNQDRLDALVQIGVDSVVAADPGSGTAGDRHLNTTTGNVIVYVDGAYQQYPPLKGWIAIDYTTPILYYYDGTAWQNFGNNFISGVTIPASSVTGVFGASQIDSSQVGGNPAGLSKIVQARSDGLIDSSFIPLSGAMPNLIKSTLGSGIYQNSTIVDIPNLTATITTTGNPVEISLVHDETAIGSSSVGVNDTDDESVGISLRFFRDVTEVYSASLSLQVGNTGSGTTDDPSLFVPASSFRHMETSLAAGTYTYKVNVNPNASGSYSVINCKLMVREL